MSAIGKFIPKSGAECRFQRLCLAQAREQYGATNQHGNNRLLHGISSHVVFRLLAYRSLSADCFARKIGLSK